MTVLRTERFRNVYSDHSKYREGDYIHIPAFIELSADVVLLATTYREVELATEEQV